MTTPNGGADWIQRNSGTTNHLSKVCITGIKTGVAVGSNGTILTTNNSGESSFLQNSGLQIGYVMLVFLISIEGVLLVIMDYITQLTRELVGRINQVVHWKTLMG